MCIKSYWLNATTLHTQTVGGKTYETRIIKIINYVYRTLRYWVISKKE